ncbi:MAG TPA: hypothetical protein VEX13_12080 [Chloroflexia bacterium]|nr:hypothetical protein [Chloroflexia bacterium]
MQANTSKPTLKHHLPRRAAIWSYALAAAMMLPGLAMVGTRAEAAQNTAFKSVWERADYPVAAEQVKRSWLWGPQPMVTTSEPLAESPGGKREVQYYDKSRMEINDPAGDPNSQWYVTNGLLVVEMVSGRMQVGANQFEQRDPARLIVAGETSTRMSPINVTPTYESLGRVATLAPGQNQAQARMGQEVIATLSANGTVGTQTPRMTPGITLPRIAYFEPATGHNVPDVFWDFMNQQGTVYENGQFVEGQVFNWVYAMGYPITEPYWIETYIGEQQVTVMMQAFQRRLLTYNPNNEQQWRVEMGNVGAHYYQWRYGKPAPNPSSGSALTTRFITEDGQLSGIMDPFYAATTTQEEWSQIWQRHTSNSERPLIVPAVDFNREFVVSAFWGSQANACYKLDIESVKVTEQTITVQVNQYSRGGVCATVLVQPHEIVAVSRANLGAGRYSVVFMDNNNQTLATSEITLR